MGELSPQPLRSVAVGIFSALRPGLRAADLAAAAALPLPAAGLPVTGPPLQLGSPWADNSGLAAVLFSDIFGVDVPRPMTRAEAMAVPAAARARHIIATTVARTTMRAYRGDSTEPLAGAARPAWLERTDGVLSPFHTKLWTADDLVWFGWSCWSRVNGTDGYPLRTARLPMGSWSMDDQLRVKVDRNDGRGMVYVPDDEVILIPGPHEGLLSFAQDAIRHGGDLQRAAGRAARNPAAHVVLQQESGTPLPQESADANVMTIPKLVAMWVKARRGENGGVAYSPPNIKPTEMGTFDRHLVLDGRNAAAVDIARAASLPADMVDATTEGSLVYQNRVDNDRRGLDYGIGAYMGAITARLSQGDVTPAGQRVAFDVEEWLDQTVPGQAPQATPAPPAGRPAPVRPIAAVQESA